MKLKKKKIGIVVGILIGIALIGGVVINKSGHKANALAGPQEGQLVKVAKSEKTDIQTKVSATGTLYADVSETIFAESNNKVVIINKKVGDLVKKGEVILTLDKDVKDTKSKEIEKNKLSLETTKIELNQMQSGSKQEVLEAQSKLLEVESKALDVKENIRSLNTSLETTEIDQTSLQKTYELKQQLFTEGLASQQELDKAKKDIDTNKESMISLKNKIMSLEQDVKNLGVNKETINYNLNVLLNNVQDQKKAQSIAIKQNEIKSLELQTQTLLDELDELAITVVSPIEGVIAEMMVEEGSSVEKGKALVRVIEPHKLIVKSEVAPFYAAQLQKGLNTTIKYNGSQTIELAAKISKVSPTAVTKVGANNTSTTAIPVEIEIIDDASGLKPGIIVDVRIITNDVKGVVAIPLLATMEDKEGETYIFVIKDDFTLEKRYVEQGVANNQFIEIKGLKEGTIIVTNPTEALENGIVVNYVPFEEKVQKEGKKS